MKRMLMGLILLLLSGCGVLQRMDQNLASSVQAVHQNTAAVDRSRETIEENTHVINEATSTLDQLLRHPAVFFYFLLAAILGLFTAFLLCLFTLKGIQKSLKRVVDKKF